MQFWKGNLPRNIQLMLEFLKGSFLVLHFSYYRLVTFLMMLSVRLLSMMVILLSTLNVIRHLICGNNQNWCLNLNLTYRTTWIAIDVKMDGSVLEKKSSFKMLGLTFSSKLEWGSFAKTASKKIGVLIHSMKFLSPEVALYLYKSTIQPYMEYCCYVWCF